MTRGWVVFFMPFLFLNIISNILCTLMTDTQSLCVDNFSILAFNYCT